MAGKRQVEARWGVSFWQLVADFAEQGLSRFDTARALGYRPDSFCTLLSENPGKDPFELANVPLSYTLDSGEPFLEALERMAAEGLSLSEAARVIGYYNHSGLQYAMRVRGIHVDFPGRRRKARKAVSPRGPNVSRGWPTWEQVDVIARRLKPGPGTRQR